MVITNNKTPGTQNKSLIVDHLQNTRNTFKNYFPRVELKRACTEKAAELQFGF